MKDILEENKEEIINEKLMIAIIKESGEVAWITVNDPTLKQQKQFQKMFVVSSKPSFVMNIILFIEIFILKILNTIEEVYKGEDNE